MHSTARTPDPVGRFIHSPFKVSFYPPSMTSRPVPIFLFSSFLLFFRSFCSSVSCDCPQPIFHLSNIFLSGVTEKTEQFEYWIRELISFNIWIKVFHFVLSVHFSFISFVNAHGSNLLSVKIFQQIQNLSFVSRYFLLCLCSSP
ncbi:unnamed protein product [Coffea canephora]|uniref:Uncharacterized protein n=1 Tax=Coffea canephora TaxID=49390 RepID=A0A068TPL0_COFCA|nr:unnamed protein product [Coffea canephora]